MKKRMIILLLLLCVVFIYRTTLIDIPFKSTYTSYDQERTSHTYEDLKENNVFIIKAKVLKGRDNILVKSGAEVLFGYTVTDLKVEAVLKGQLAETNIQVTENYYTQRHTRWLDNSVESLETDETYIMFLVKYDDDSRYAGKYFIADQDYGKYKIIKNYDASKTYSAETLNIRPAMLESEYLDWYRKVMKEFGE